MTGARAAIGRARWNQTSIWHEVLGSEHAIQWHEEVGARVERGMRLSTSDR